MDGFFGKNAISLFFFCISFYIPQKNGHKLAKLLKTQYDAVSELAVTLYVSVEAVFSLSRFCFRGQASPVSRLDILNTLNGIFF
jgi:hypothetical protein